MNDDYQNIFYDNEHSKQNSISLIDTKVNNFLGFESNYIFSTEPNEYQKDILNIKRYAVFIDDPIYIPNTDLFELDDFILSDPDRPTNFTSNNKYYWAIKQNDVFIEI